MVGGEPQALFPGEQSDGFESTARIWVNVYSDILAFVRRALADGLGGADVDALRGKERLFSQRLAFWETELGRLRSSDTGDRAAGF